MAFDLIPRSFFSSPSRWPFDFDDVELSSFLPSSGLSISENDKHVFVEAAVPGIDPDRVEITYDKGVLWVKADQEREENNKDKKFYRKAASSFSYRVAVPGNIDESKEPEAVCKNGVMKITFAKLPEVQPKKISVKKE